MNILWKLKRKIRKTIITYSSNAHPSSYPFISGDTFRSLANHIYESGATFDPKSVAENDIVFVQSDVMHKYFSEIHPSITNPYKLITHNGDWNITDKELRFIDDKIIHWFAQNVLTNHPRVTPIPIGLENMSYANAGYIPLYTNSILKKIGRLPRILAAFNVASNFKDRNEAMKILRDDIKVDVISKRPDQPGYVSRVRKYCFIASPPGNGDDCIRTWESMYLGAIPIVIESVGNEYFRNLGLPLMILDKWSKLKGLSEYDLQKKYDLIMSQADRRALFMDYWIDLIKSEGEKFSGKK
ncbi:MAG: hypothetical protein WCG02_02395 [Candidatus Taylorbacteria bacterium]